MTSTVAILAARLMFGGAFLVAAWMKFGGMEATAGYIASIGFPFPLFFAWLAAFLEVGLALAFFTGAFFTEAAALAAAYVVFLTIEFHGPSRWTDPMAFGLFINHLTFIAGLLFAAVHGPGSTMVLDWRLPWQAPGGKRAGGDTAV
jgi:putative oxidoreductase